MRTPERVSLWVLILALLVCNFINIEIWEVQQEINDILYRALEQDGGAE